MTRKELVAFITKISSREFSLRYGTYNIVDATTEKVSEYYAVCFEGLVVVETTLLSDAVLFATQRKMTSIVFIDGLTAEERNACGDNDEIKLLLQTRAKLALFGEIIKAKHR